MEQLISVRSLFKETDAYAGKQIKVGGWVRNLRASKNFGFINLSDGTFFSQVQVVYGSELANFAEISKLNIGAAVIVTGTLVLTPEAKQPFELQASEVFVEGPSTPDYPIQPKRHSMEYLRTIDASASAHEHLPGRLPRPQPHRLRHPQVLPGARLRLCPHAAHHRLRLRGRGRDVPGHDARSRQPAPHRGRQDRLQPGLLRQGDEPDRLRPAQRRDASRMAFRNIYTFGPTFRAENSNTTAPRGRVLDDRAGDRLRRPRRTTWTLAEDMIKYRHPPTSWSTRRRRWPSSTSLSTRA